jgi:hypothetical protein
MVETLTLEEQREAASLIFPEAWAATFAMPGWRRRRRQANLRKAAVNELILRTLPAGACCARCKHKTRMTMVDGFVCSLQSDFHGYVIVQPEGVCADYDPV